MNITGTLIKNFFHCKRQAYLFYYALNFRSDIIRVGEIMHEEQNSKELVFEKIKIDDIKGEYLVEYKKTSSNLEGTRFQVLWYLKYFYEKNVPLKGLIKDLTYNQEYVVEFNENSKKALNKVINEIKSVLKGGIPKRLTKKKFCKECSFFDYCWVDS